MRTLKLDKEEKELIEELERDEWVSTISSVLHEYVNRKIKI